MATTVVKMPRSTPMAGWLKRLIAVRSWLWLRRT
jgi:hypothetical protein